MLILSPHSDEAFVLAEGEPACRPDEDEVADEACPGFCLVLGAFKFEAAAGDAKVVPQSPCESYDEAYEHPENSERRFFHERRENHREAEPKFKLRINERKEIVDEIEVHCREELVLRHECRKLVWVLNLENRGEDEHATDTNAAERFESADGKILLQLDGGEDERTCNGYGADSHLDVVAVGLRPQVDKPVLVGEGEECFWEADFSNTHGYEETCY